MGVVGWLYSKLKVETMAESIVDKLLQSFDELERCICVTKEVLGQKEGVPADIVSRVNQYSDIVLKQRSLAHELRDLIDNENWAEVGRRVKIINGLSTMIRDDAQAILSAAYTGEHSNFSETAPKEKQFLV